LIETDGRYTDQSKEGEKSSKEKEVEILIDLAISPQPKIR
jgi:hypothetical protein